METQEIVGGMALIVGAWIACFPASDTAKLPLQDRNSTEMGARGLGAKL
jgi:hypothetical protein